MGKLLLTALFALIVSISLGQETKGKIIVDHLYSASLENPGGENPTRRVTVYLPPGYENNDDRYPVIYYLHGFTESDSLTIASGHFDKLLDKAIATGTIEPLIVVMPDQHTLYRGSLYTNSSLTGNWSDFTAKNLVTYVGQNYRTLKDSKSRGISGYSMGGYGAIKIGMLHPEVFSSIYSL